MTQLNGQLQDLKVFCIQNLKRHYNQQERLFCFREFVNPREKDSTLSFRYTVIALLGLLTHKEHPLVGDCFDLDEMLRQIIEKCQTCDDIQDVGLLLWLDAFTQSGYAPRILKKMESLIPQEKEKYIATYELAWLVTGVAYALKKYKNLGGFEFLPNYGIKLFRQLRERYNPETHLFFHCAPVSLKRKIRRPISDFADQIYSIYANLAYFELTGEAEAEKTARDCATKLLELQGPNGEWWWLYNADNGKIAYRYPVYTVHQDGMAPMVLVKLAQVIQMNTGPVIEKSFNWLFSCNGTPIIDYKQSHILRGVRLEPGYTKHLGVGFSLLGADALSDTMLYRFFRKHGTINEYRAYHLGWALYFIHYWEQFHMENRGGV